MVGHKEWIKSENCVGMIGLWLIVVDNFCPCQAQQSYQCIMFLLCNLQIRSSRIMPGYGVTHCKGLFRAFYKHSAKRRDHALATEMSGHLVFSNVAIQNTQ